MFHLLILISLMASSAFGYTLDASILTQLGYDNQSTSVYIQQSPQNNITDIDPNAFKGYTKLEDLELRFNRLSKIDLELFKDCVNLQNLVLSFNPLTQFTNSKKIIFPFLQNLEVDDCLLDSLDSNVINGLPNITAFFSSKIYNGSRLSPIKPNQFSAWKKLQRLYITTRNQSSLTKESFNGINSLTELYFINSDIKTVEVNTLLALPNVTSVSLGLNSLTSFEYLQIPSELRKLNLGGNKMNYFMLSRTMGFLQSLSIGGNLFRSFKSMDFSFLANLTYLDLSNNPHAYPNEIAGHLKFLPKLDLIVLNNLSISTIDSNFFKQNTNLRVIYSSFNKISSIPFDTFSNLKRLQYFDFSNNEISAIDNRTFLGLNNLNIILLKFNKLTKIDPRTFYNLTSTYSLDLSNNLISEIDSSAFTGCYSLMLLNLANNRLSKILPGAFENIKIGNLSLNFNLITELDGSIFDGIISLAILEIRFNNISKINAGTFNGIKIDYILDLQHNLLTGLDNSTFLGQNQLSMIDLSYNMISTIEAGTFNGLTNLQYIHLESNDLSQLDSSLFDGCDNLKEIYLFNNPNLSQNNLQSLCPTNAVNCKVNF